MATKLSIWNRALQLMGSEKLVDVETNNKKSRALETAYEPVRDALLEEFPWGFAKKFWTGSPDASYAPAHTYAYQYILPADYLALIGIKTNLPYEEISPTSAPGSEPSKVAIATDDAGPLEIRYIGKVENEAIYSPLFAEVLAHRLALACVEEITQSNSKKEEIKDSLKVWERKAKLSASKRRTPEKMSDGSWFQSAGFVN